MNFGLKLYWQLSDDDLSKIYQTAKREGVLNLVAFDVDINEECFKLFARRVEVFGAAFNDEGRPVGFFFLANFEGATARFHFCFLKAGRKDRRVIGQTVLDWCFGTFEFQSLIGVIPSINQGACQFAREMGGKEMGIIPGMCWINRLKRSVGGVQFIFTKGDSNGRHVCQ